MPLVDIQGQTQAEEWMRSGRELHALARFEMAGSLAIGSTYWTPDTINTALVKSALDEMQIKDFPTAWERVKYRVDPSKWYENLSALQGNVWILDACQLLLARKMGIINKLPAVSEDELDDRNKGDFLVKLLALGQVLWLIVQLIARGAKGLVPSQLEIVVLAFSSCTFVTYLLLWSKPQDVKTTIYVPASRYPSMYELGRLSIYGPDVLYGTHRTRHWIPNNSDHCNGPYENLKFTLASILATILFGSLHCLAWNLNFPTRVERLLWRVAAVISAGGPLIAIVFTGLFFIGSSGVGVKRAGTGVFFLCLIAVSYILARVYIVIEIFRSLCFSDPEVFLTTWSVNIPHLSS